MKTFTLLLLVFCFVSLWGSQEKSEFNKVQVEGVENPVISLNGTWKFSETPPVNYWENGVDSQSWPDIQVPGECQMQGFAIKHDTPYVYKKQFDIPDDYRGKQIHLNFYGVYSYARIWVNGTFIREHYGGFTKWSCAISEHVKAGETAVLTVEIVDRTDDISYGSGYAKHQVGGILRDVELVALPEQHFKQLYFETELDDQYVHAELKVNYELQLDIPCHVEIEVFDPQGEVIEGIEKELNSVNGIITIPVEQADKWDAEHPKLYTVVTTLLQNGEELYSLSEKIGFREVELEGNKLLVNGFPVKLRGACRHDIHPTLGRMTTPEYDKKDVLLAKECNMNFIRTSHYPPSEAFLDYCDAYGIYVEDETAVCFVGSHRTEAYRATGASQDSDQFTGRYLSQLQEMVQNHRNHPSVILWSIGNENVYGKNFDESYKWVKEHDSTRPVIYSYPGQVAESAKIFEILSMHYPSWQGNLDQYEIKTHKFDYKEMPVLFDEWAHVACYNNFELKGDPNVRNFWGQSLDSMWTYLFEAEGGLGGAIWCMLDETFMLPSDLPGFNQWWGILDKNIIPATYMGPCVGYGEWGIVDTWRRKKPEFWGTKKAYSPTKILIKDVDIFKPDKELRLPVHNRFDHTDFNELKIVWQYADKKGQLDPVNLKPHEKGQLSIPAKHWKNGEKLLIAFYQSDSMLVDMYHIRLGTPAIDIPVCESGNIQVLENEAKFHLKGAGFSLDVNRHTGLLENVSLNDELILKSGPHINLIVPGNRKQYSNTSMEDLALEWKCTEVSYEVENGIVTIYTAGKYKKLKVTYTISVDANGVFQIDYSVKHDIKDQTIQEAGLKFICGSAFETLAWNRNPYFTAYPEGALGAEKGEVSLSYKPEMKYREKPNHPWEYDSKGFFYFGLEKELPYSNLVRSLKENIYTYSLSTESNSEVKLFSRGKQACRFDQIDGDPTLIVNDQWDYNSLLWGNYMKKLPLNDQIEGRVTMAIKSRR